MNEEEKKKRKQRIIIFSIIGILIAITIIQSIVLVSLKSKLDNLKQDYELIQPDNGEN